MVSKPSPPPEVLECQDLLGGRDGSGSGIGSRNGDSRLNRGGICVTARPTTFMSES